ncbi:MAG: hypothetical protein H6594_05620 [Flavobacteriales bacterium]|nr:hypothetical protein [Flavobacteriales bacterium]
MREQRHLLSLLLLVTGQLALAQWTPLNSGITSIQSMTSLNGDLYAASYPNGVKKSVTGGTSWTSANTGLTQSGSSYYVRSVGTDGTHLFAGTQNGVFRSDNAAANWTIMNGTMPFSTTNYVNKFFTFSGVTFAVFSASIANGGGIYRTDNAGSTWNIGHSGMSSNATVYHLTRVGGTIYASSSVGLWTSTDLGLSWTALSSANYSVYGLASISNRLVITSTFGYRYSTNNGGTWNDATGDPANPTDGEIVAFDGMLFALSGTANACYRSTDNGSTWAAYNTGFGAVDAGAQEEFFVDGNILYCSALFDIYSITGTNVDVNDPAPLDGWTGPTVTYDRIVVHLNKVPTAASLLLITSDGRVVRHVNNVGIGDNTFDVSALDAGVYRVLIAEQGATRMQVLGTAVVE